jgi:PAS domain S-box-containing protein
MKTVARNLLQTIGLAVVYFMAGKLGLALAYYHPLAAPLWPPTGIALAAILLFGYRVWPGIVVGAFTVNWVTLGAFGAEHQKAIPVSLGIAIGNTLEALTGAWLINRFAEGRAALRQPKTVFLFAALGGAASTTVSATLGLASSGLAGLVAKGDAAEFWLTWWLGDMIGALLVAPFFLVWSVRGWPRLDTKRLAEAAGLLLLLVLTCAVAFDGWLVGRRHGAPLSFMAIPLLLWSAFRFGLRGTTAAALVAACLATLGTLHGSGPFAIGNPHASLLLLQNYIAVLSVLSLVLAADVAQRQRIAASMLSSEERYRQLFDAIPLPVWVHDYHTLRFLAVNQAAIEHYGYSREEFLNMTIKDIRPAEDIPKALEFVEKARTGLAVSGEWRHRRKNGSLIEVEVARRNLSFGGRPAALVLSADVTVRKAAEARAAAFSELGRRLSASRTPKEAASIIVDTAEALLGWDACTFDLCSRDQKSVQAVLYVDTIEGTRRDVTAQCQGTRPTAHMQEVCKAGPRLILRQKPVSFPTAGIPFGDKMRPSASLIFVPVRKETETIGVLSIQSYAADAYSQSDLELLQALADHCGGALERLRAEEEIDRLNRELRHHLEELETVFNAAPVGIAVARDPQCRVIRGNPTCAAMLGVNGGEQVFGNGSEASVARARILQRGEEVPAEALPMQAAARLGARIQGEELDFVFPDGRVLNAYVSASPLYDEAGRVRGSLGIFVDLSERRRTEAALRQRDEEVLRLNSELERRVSERTAQLEAINRELEAFSYSVSHDLRAPLRSIRGFSEVLLQRYASSLDKRGQEFLKRTCESSQQMDRLIEDLLQLSRVSRTEMQRQPVNLSSLAAAIGAELRQAEPQRAVELVITPELRAQGDERLLRVVLENLLRNAWKFTSKQPAARIEFGFNPERPAFFVRDNGAGFDMAYADKLFGVFQRLHSAAEFPGTGVGLATVQRIINRHGGFTWAEGVPARGATFYFSLPAQESI